MKKYKYFSILLAFSLCMSYTIIAMAAVTTSQSKNTVTYGTYSAKLEDTSGAIVATSTTEKMPSTDNLQIDLYALIDGELILQKTVSSGKGSAGVNTYIGKVSQSSGYLLSSYIMKGTTIQDSLNVAYVP